MSGARTAPLRSAIYTGSLLHVRDTPRNAFRYPVQFYGLDLDELPELERRLPLFSVNRFNAVALRDRDHLFTPLKQGLVDWIAAQGVELGPNPRVTLLTNLAVLGYVFNPVSFYTVWREGDATELTLGGKFRVQGAVHNYSCRIRQGRVVMVEVW